MPPFRIYSRFSTATSSPAVVLPVAKTSNDWPPWRASTARSLEKPSMREKYPPLFHLINNL